MTELSRHGVAVAGFEIAEFARFVARREVAAPQSLQAGEPIARWASRAAWEASQANRPADPELLAHAKVMRAAAERLHTQVFYEEVSDLTDMS